MSKSRIRINDFVRLFRLGYMRLNSPQDYQALEEFQGQLLARYLTDHRLSLDGKMVLDLGAGFGGYARGLRSSGAKVTCLDITLPKGDFDPSRVCANAFCTPFATGTFDLLVSISLIEHIKEPEELVTEMVRITKPDGYIYLSFPPFYSPVGGHHFSPWHLFGEKVAVWAFSKRKWHVNEKWTVEPYDFKTDSFEKGFGNYGLFKLSIKQARSLLTLENISVLDQSVKYFRVNTSLIPFLGEGLTWHVQFLARKMG